MTNKRKSGVLLHPTSLPGPFQIGDLGDEASVFIHWLEAAGQSLWQVLPLGPTGLGNSPYGALSSFAGNPLLVSPRRLEREGFLTDGDLVTTNSRADRVDFRAAYEEKNRILRTAWAAFQRDSRGLGDEFLSFREDEETKAWLDDWALFRALKEAFDGKIWTEWDREIAFRHKRALVAAGKRLRPEIDFHCFVQWLVDRQWKSVRNEAREHGISIVGDLPIYVAWDSADVWANRRLFSLDREGRPTVVAGVPPDYFSETGQLWGNPLYRWGAMRRDGYKWWIARIRASLRFADWIRLDHFRGFAAYWEVPSGAETAINGRWVRGPGQRFFDAIKEELGGLPIIAEDLGVITKEVLDLLESASLPGMKLLQFGFGAIDSAHAPHRHLPNSIAYTGTHDNDTTRGWYRSADHEERNRATSYLGPIDDESIHWSMIRAVETSVANWAIIPAQDISGLGSEGRMNTPGEAEGNWEWRSRGEQFDRPAAEHLNWLTSLGGRHPAQGDPEYNQAKKGE